MPRIKMKRDNVSLTRSGGPLSVFVFHSEKRPVPGAGGGRPRGTQGEGRDEESRKIRKKMRKMQSIMIKKQRMKKKKMIRKTLMKWKKS